MFFQSNGEVGEGITAKSASALRSQFELHIITKLFGSTIVCVILGERGSLKITQIIQERTFYVPNNIIKFSCEVSQAGLGLAWFTRFALRFL
jgi:hypothetical protein